ncbi:TetR-like C-terminal domain-containing protein [Actinoplanes sp. NPDC049265]|uniref:TetR-like C-terminal domain-containing protein n=1 Tax=Actinoplanes sp. NPDC049265 TaxID=3363902 RepID=UPI0037140631
MPRAGLDAAAVVAAAARLADEGGLANVRMGRLAELLGVRTPSLYKHIGGQADLSHRIAVLAVTELTDALRRALSGRDGRDALAAAAHTIRAYVRRHPGRYAISSPLPLEPLAAVLHGYRLDPADTVHTLRAMRSLIHGFATLEAAGGFAMDTDVDESFEWLISRLDEALRHNRRPTGDRPQ